jgi:hypothetical protein
MIYVSPNDATLQGHFALLGELVKQCRTYTMEVGTEAIEDTATISRLLASSSEVISHV